MSKDNGARKDDQGKLPWSLLMGGAGLALKEIVKVLQFGARKYAEGGWQNVPNGYRRYRDALYRHLHSIEQNGPWVRDAETGLLEWAHVGCNVIFLIYYVAAGKVHEDGRAVVVGDIAPVYDGEKLSYPQPVGYLAGKPISSIETPEVIKQSFQRADGV